MKIPNPNTHSFLNQQKDQPPKKDTQNNPSVVMNDILYPEELIHEANIKKFMEKHKGNIQSSFTISDDDILLQRTTILFYSDPKVTIKHIEEVIDGELIETFEPETILDYKRICQF